jgi:hypothetical protein
MEFILCIIIAIANSHERILGDNAGFVTHWLVVLSHFIMCARSIDVAVDCTNILNLNGICLLYSTD